MARKICKCMVDRKVDLLYIYFVKELVSYKMNVMNAIYELQKNWRNYHLFY